MPELDARQEDASSRSEKPEPEEFQPGTADSIRHIVLTQYIQILARRQDKFYGQLQATDSPDFH